MEDMKQGKSEFLELLDAMKDQLYLLDENSNIIYEKLNSFKDISEPVEKSSSCNELSQPGVIGALWECVEKLKRNNISLNQSKNALTRFVG